MKVNKKKPKILLDLLSFNPKDGGFTFRIYDLLESCSHLQDFDFSIVYNSRYEEFFSKYRFEKIPIFFPPKLRFVVSSIILPILVRVKKYDGLHCEISAIPYFIGIPSSIMVMDFYFLINQNINRGGFANEFNYFYWRKFFIGSLLRAEVLGALSETTRNDYYKYTEVKKQVIIVYPVINVPVEKIPIKPWPDVCTTLRILFIGSIIPRKNLPFLLAALQKLERKWVLDIVGNSWWGLEELLLSCQKDERVTIHGFVNDHQRNEFMKSAHLVVVPSLYEGFGLTAAEGINYSCLALTSKGSAFDEYVPDGCRFDLDDPDNITCLINKLTSTSYEILLAKSKLNIKKFSRDLQVESYKNLFSSLVEKN